MIERTYIAKSPHWWRLTATAYFLSTADNIGQATYSRSDGWHWWAYGKGNGTAATRDAAMDAVEQALSITVLGERP